MTQTQTAQRLINVIIVNPNDNSITNAVINKDNGLKDYYAFMSATLSIWFLIMKLTMFM